MNLRDYFFVKCFETANYRESFNDGTNIYINSTAHFWKLENAFQQDFEGMILKQSGKGCVFAAKSGFEQLIKESSSLDDLIKKSADSGAGKKLFDTSDMNFRLDGYICCFYLLPKSEVSFTKTSLSILSKAEREDMALFHEKYLNDSTTKMFYASIYDAYTFCQLFCTGMESRGYEITMGAVEYKDVTMIERIKMAQERNYKSIVFTKPTSYSYQKEFRIFLIKKGENTKDHISESGIEIYNSLVCNYDYTKPGLSI